MIRRSIEVLFACGALICAAPILVVASVAIILLDGRPVFFSQRRIGLNGKSFRFWKFRSMRKDSDEILQWHLSRDSDALKEWNMYLRLDKDPRHLPVIGRALRKTSIDELPQLWNVLRGEMSLIGPRPLPIDQVSQLTARAQAERTSVKPGLTGLWQVVGRGDTTIPTLERLDRLYICNRSWKLDSWILFKTIPSVLSGKGAY